ncbi:MAG: hypothetical protein A3C84_03280 [Candidatus Ryanbacteria bacterium RIFCSPHIGHO2_02_FULL_48_12]|uniref:PAS domain-containing protein n=1 Tax=Candidatus Ryanbacteria bacterium RIFCSPHIGHO2_01_FULL_48_27 TaxID=1802115 RepID=A0A1G2G6B9_9BACT|nr:MAG: hypothetical protein A2756_02710 [Candidatus Ryanbacteria bacterium RIFCSPHIGHO2_01_FULL_48_27]OGZ49949.1 MAG: hypothetical protein A3C84_03280 [Candidatus Ryanbacteria bacterium RIFCSPHIGHO2_02_FULL_48_12]
MKTGSSRIAKDLRTEAKTQSNSHEVNLTKKGRIISVKRITKRTTHVAIKVPEDFSFIAGQYIWLMIPKLEYPDPKGNVRMFSIASSPNRHGQIDIIFRTSESGYKKTLIAMKPGTGVIFSGPYGSLRLPEDTSLPIILVAGGVGVVPFLSMIRFSSETSSGHEIALAYANDGKDESAYLDELSQLAKNNPKFTLATFFGLVDQTALEKFAGREALWFVAGPRGFVDYVGNFLTQHRVPSERIVFEQFYPGQLLKSEFEQKLESVNPDFAAAGYPYLLALDNASNHIVITDTNGIILYANKGAETMTGYTLAEMKGNTPRLWGGLMPVDFYKDLRQTIKYDRQAFCGEIKNRRKNQSEYYALMRVSPIINANDALIGFVATEEEVTIQKRIEKDLGDARMAAQNVFEDLEDEKEKLAQTKAKDEAILASIAAGCIAVNKNGEIILMNKTAEKMLGYTGKESIGKKWYEVLHLQDESCNLIPPEKGAIYAALSASITNTVIATTTSFYFSRYNS